MLASDWSTLSMYSLLRQPVAIAGWAGLEKPSANT